MHGRFFRYPSSTKLCPSCSPLEDSEFATTNQNLSGTAAWINQTTTIKSITLGKKSIFQSKLGFSRPGEFTNVWSKFDFQITAGFWVGFLFGFVHFFFFFLNIIFIRGKVFHQKPTGALNTLPALWRARYERASQAGEEAENISLDFPPLLPFSEGNYSRSYIIHSSHPKTRSSGILQRWVHSQKRYTKTLKKLGSQRSKRPHAWLAYSLLL